MEERIPKAGEFYLHFQKKTYQIITVATDIQTNEQMVVYQAMFGSFQNYVCALHQFNSPVDKKNYPDCTQFYQFQKLTVQEVAALQTQEEETGADETVAKIKQISEPTTVLPKQEDETEKIEPTQSVGIPEEKKQQPILQAADTKISADHTPQEEQADPRLMAFLDADSYDEKYRVLVAMGQDVDDRIINDLAVVLDVVIPEGDVDERMRQLKSCVETKRRYESNRLR